MAFEFYDLSNLTRDGDIYPLFQDPNGNILNIASRKATNFLKP